MRNRRVLCRRFRLRNRYRLEIFKKQKVYWRFQDFFCTFAYVKRYFTILLCSLYALLGMAQNNMQVAHYSTKEGLPHDIVYCSLKSKDSFLWFGTWFGLSRFDGSRFANYSDAYNSSSDQPPRKVEWLAEDALGNLWIKTLDWKLSVFFKQTERFEDVYEELKPYARNLQVIKILADGTGKILLLTKDKNLLLAETLKDGSIRIQTLVDARKYINTFNYQLRQDVVQLKASRANYVGKNYQIYSVPVTAKNRKWTLGMWQQYFARKSKEHFVYHTPNGCVWQLDESHTALVCRNPKTGWERRYPVSGVGKVVEPKFITTSHHGYFYLSGAGEIIYIDPQTMEGVNLAFLPKFQDHKPDSHFLNMNLDKDGLLWLTSADNGIYRVSFTPNQFRVISLPDGDKSGVKAICQLKNGDVLVGARSKNVYLLDMQGRVKQVFDYAHHQIGSIYHAMCDDRQNLWLSTKGDGLVKLTPDSSRPIGYRIAHYRHDARDPYSISGNNVYMTCQDSHHRIWVATLDGGLNLLQEQGGKVRFYNKYHGMKNYPGYGLYMDARNLVEDSHQRMWVGTMDGLMSFKTDFKSVGDLRFETYRNTDINTRANSDIYGLYKDNNRQVWMCTFGGGLSRLDGFDEVTHLPILTSLGAKEGLHNDVIISILEDKMGRLWLVNADGLSCYDYQSDRIQHFDNSDGFPDVQLEESSAALIQNGEIWLGCKEGILAYQPERIHTTRLQYPIYIIGGEVNNRDIRSYNQPAILEKSMVYTDRLTLRHSQSMFTLEFAALNFCNPERISYRYQLKGYDHDWHYVGKNRRASYTNVPSGTYQFIVEVMDATNPDSHSTRELTITILPPWWATWWAYLIYIILISVASYYAFRYAKYQIRLKNNIYIQNQLAEYKRKFNAEQQDKQFADKVRRFMEANLTNADFEIDMLAQELGMSRSAFFKKTKAVMGCSPSDMVKDFRLSHAVELLKHSGQSITDVAYCCGFTDVGYFGKCFRKKYGMSPREYVAQQQESEIKK